MRSGDEWDVLVVLFMGDQKCIEEIDDECQWQRFGEIFPQYWRIWKSLEGHVWGFAKSRVIENQL